MNNKYTVNYADKLGEGRYSTIYSGFDNNQNKVAVKILHNQNSKFEKYILEEITIVRKLITMPHKNIVKFYDVFDEIDETYIIMEYCEMTLDSLLKGPIKEVYAQFYSSQIAEGMKHLYDIGIRHQDLKPQNIMLTNDKKEIKIIDFGLSSDNITNSITCGSPMYMSPEVIKKRECNDKTDIWSIGLILYKMLYGIHPYNEFSTSRELYTNIDLLEISIPPEDSKIDISEKCKNLLKRLLDKNTLTRITWEELFDCEWINEYMYITDDIVVDSDTPDTPVIADESIPMFQMDNLTW